MNSTTEHGGEEMEKDRNGSKDKVEEDTNKNEKRSVLGENVKVEAGLQEEKEEEKKEREMEEEKVDKKDFEVIDGYPSSEPYDRDKPWIETIYNTGQLKHFVQIIQVGVDEV